MLSVCRTISVSHAELDVDSVTLSRANGTDRSNPSSNRGVLALCFQWNTDPINQILPWYFVHPARWLPSCFSPHLTSNPTCKPVSLGYTKQLGVNGRYGSAKLIGRVDSYRHPKNLWKDVLFLHLYEKREQNKKVIEQNDQAGQHGFGKDE